MHIFVLYNYLFKLLLLYIIYPYFILYLQNFRLKLILKKKFAKQMEYLGNF